MKESSRDQNQLDSFINFHKTPTVTDRQTDTRPKLVSALAQNREGKTRIEGKRKQTVA